ncbi:hypothetical protein CPC08DRAFT_727367 [Agrocybe pediades]|nr:hypothetical protein CPC08DRAFT_727367 [Agrocybe pediades]
MEAGETNESLSMDQPHIMDGLPPELFWKIFMINTERGNEPLTLTDSDSDHRLDTARRCSQVCRLWRTLLLQFSSIWGRLLHIQNFERTTDTWRVIVASRIGDASLCITGYVTDSTRPFIFAILQEKWRNVQELEIKDDNLYDEEVLPTWSFLGREAPKLEAFELWADIYHTNPSRIFPFSPLFGNTAPRLKIFKLWEPFQFSLPTPWMANLHSVAFVGPLNGPLILSALKCMPSLRELYVSGNSLQPMFRGEDNDLDKLHLPLLESLIIDDFYNPMDMILLLESITLSPEQRPLLQTLFIPEVDETFPDHQRVHRAVTKWIHAYTSASPPRHLALSDCDQILTLADIRNVDAGEAMRVDLFLDNNQSHVTIEEIVASLRYSVVEELDVFFMDSPPTWPLRPLFEALQSVTRLTAVGYYIEPLFHDMLQFSLFPDLHTIDLLGPETDGGATIIPTVIQFLEHRVLTGSPLFVLDLSSFDSAALSDTNKEHLDKIPGLSVILPGDYSGW